MSQVSESMQVRTHLPTVDLVVQKLSSGAITGSLYSVTTDEYRSTQQCLCCGVESAGHAHTYSDKHLNRVDLWIGSTSFELPWLELLKVADFLRLDIELPHPPEGTLVPA